MPFVPAEIDKNPYTGTSDEIGNTQAPGLAETFGAQFFLHTTLGSGINSIRYGYDRVTPESILMGTVPQEKIDAYVKGDVFDATSELEPKYRPYADRFQGIVTEADAEKLKQKLDFEIKYRDLEERAGIGKNLLTGIAAQAIDPINFVPFLGAGAKGVSVGGSVARGAGLGLMSTAAQEPILYGMQETRTVNESLLNMVYGAGFGGAFGGALHALGKGAGKAKGFVGEKQDNHIRQEFVNFANKQWDDLTPDGAITDDAISSARSLDVNATVNIAMTAYNSAKASGKQLSIDDIKKVMSKRITRDAGKVYADIGDTFNQSKAIDYWRAGLQKIKDGTAKGSQLVAMGRPSHILRQLGLSKAQLTLPASKVAIIKKEHSEITDKILDTIGANIQDPQYVLRSSTERNSLVDIPVRLPDGRVFIVAIKKDALPYAATANVEKSNIITSIYIKKDPEWLDREYAAGRMIYDRDGKFAGGQGERANRSNSLSRQQARAGHTNTRKKKILTKKDIVKGYKQDARGSVGFGLGVEDGNNLIRLFEGADSSTLVHESAHHWLEAMLYFNKELGQKSPFANTIKEIDSWAKKQSDGEYNDTARQEAFATGFENYLREGVSPNQKLKEIFDKFRDWLVSIYQSADDIGIPLNDEMRQVYANLIEPDISRWQSPYAKTNSLSAAQTGQDMIWEESIGDYREVKHSDYDSKSKAANIVSKFTPSLTPNDLARRQNSTVFRGIWERLVETQIDSDVSRQGLTGQSIESIVDVTEKFYVNKIYEIMGNLPREYRKGANLDELNRRIADAIANPDVEADPVILAAAKRLREEIGQPIEKMMRDAGLISDDKTWSMDQFYFQHGWDADKISADIDGFRGYMQGVVDRWMDETHRADIQEIDDQIADLNIKQAEIEEALPEISDTNIEGMTPEQFEEFAEYRLQVAKEPPSLKQFIINEGGLWRAEASDIAELEYRRPGFIRVEKRSDTHKNGGLSLDDMLQRAKEEGYLPDDAEINDLIDRIGDDIRGDRVYSAFDDDALIAWKTYQEMKDITSQGISPSEIRKIRKSVERKVATVKKRIASLESKKENLIDDFDDHVERARDRDEIVMRIEERIMGREDDRSVAQRSNSSSGSKVTVDATGYRVRTRKLRNTKKRAIDIKRSEASQWMRNDVAGILTRSVRSVAAEAELTNRLGDGVGSAQRIAIQRDFNRLIAAASDEAEYTKLSKELPKVLREFDNAILSIKGLRTAHMQSEMGDVFRGLRNLSYASYLGNVVISSVADVARAVMAGGMRGLLSGASFNALMRNLKHSFTWEASFPDDLKSDRTWVIAERSMNSRAMRSFDLDEHLQSRGQFSTVTEKMAHYGTKISGIDRWNQLWKGVAFDLGQDRLYWLSDKSWGELREADRSWLSVLRFGEHTWEAMRQQIQTHGQSRKDGAVIRTDLWDDADLAMDALAGMKKEADSIIVTPGIGDTISTIGNYDLQHPFAKMILQFKSFFVSAQQRLTFRMAQDPDKMAAASTVMMMVIAGMAIDEIKAFTGGYEPSDNIGNRIMGGIDRSGIIPIWMEINNMAERSLNLPLAHRGASNLAAGLGLAEEADNRGSSRYGQRSALGSLAGASVGMIGDAAVTVGDFSGQVTGIGEGVTDATIKRIKNLAPYHNAPAIRPLLNLWVVPEVQDRID